MKNYFMFLMDNMQNLGELVKANFYGDDFASVEFEKDGKKYKISISSEDLNTEEGKND